MDLFDSIFYKTESSVDPSQLFLALLVSLLLGFMLSWVYRYRTLYTREFAISLIVLPAMMTMLIFFVNGNLGTGVAVAGTFSLVRFRSATSGSRELLAIFLAMIIGLTTGMGYLLVALASSTFLLVVWFLLEKWQSKRMVQPRRHLTLTVASGQNVETEIEGLLKIATAEHDLLSISSLKEGSQLKLVYEISLASHQTDVQLTQSLLQQAGMLDLALTRNAKKRKNL